MAERYMTDFKYKNAISVFHSYLEVRKDDIEVMNNLALAYYEDGQYSEGLGILNKVLSINLNDVKAYKNRALIFIKLDKVELACNDLFTAMQMGYIEQYGYDILDIYLENCEQ
jgi:Flp pilus assembly protein TadD